MLFMCQGKPQPGLSQEQRQKGLQLFGAWQPPAGMTIQAHYVSATGGDYIVVETDSVEVLIEAIATWAPFVVYEVTPIAAVQQGVERIARADTVRAQLIA
jgi:hypothetical protein